jgi:NADH-quinone oxidoreductase subunit E
MNENKKTIISPAICERIDKWILRYPPGRQQSGVFEALRLVQEANGGFLTIELMDAVAEYLEMPKIGVYEVVTFYSMYSVSPVGKNMVDICTNISCMLNGAEDLLEHVKKRLQIGLNETTADGKFTLKEVECLGACIAPPVCQINKKYYENLTPQKMDEILAEFEK